MRLTRECLRELTTPLHTVGSGVCGGGQPVDDVLERDLVAGLKSDGAPARPALGRSTAGPAHRSDHHGQRPVCGIVRVRVRQPSQHGKPAADRVRYVD
jgi:hypothetical protein